MNFAAMVFLHSPGQTETGAAPISRLLDREQQKTSLHAKPAGAHGQELTLHRRGQCVLSHPPAQVWRCV